MTQEWQLAPTAEAIDAWLARQPRRADGRSTSDMDQYGVNVWTRAGRCRCICGSGDRSERGGEAGYLTIRGEGSSNGGRVTWIAARKIVRAVGWRIPA